MYMSLLANMFRETMRSYKNVAGTTEKVADVGYSTGFPSLDMRNASVVHVKNEEKQLDFKYYLVGFADGSMNTFIGRTGSGKSTLVYQISANIIRPFPTACIFADEIESGMQDSRKETLTGFIGEELHRRVISRNTGVTSENFFERIKLIHDMRMANIDKFEYNTGYLDYKGDPIYKLEPCVYILDSWALLRPAALTSEEKISGQMSVTASAKLNTEILRRIIPMLKEANINLMIINHLLTNVKINPYEANVAQVQYLDVGERCPGGDTVMYLANNLLKLFDSKLKPELFDIDGSIIACKFCKSRTNKAGKITYLVYNQETGYDPELSLYINLKKDGVIESSGAWMYVKGHSEVKFQQKKLKDKLRTDPEFRKLFMNAAMVYLASLVDQEIEEEKLESEVNHSIVNDFYEAIKYQNGKIAA